MSTTARVLVEWSDKQSKVAGYSCGTGFMSSSVTGVGKTRNEAKQNEKLNNNRLIQTLKPTHVS